MPRLARLALAAACVAIAVLAGLSLFDAPVLPSSSAVKLGDVVTLRDAEGEYRVVGRHESGQWRLRWDSPDAGTVYVLADTYDVKAVVRRAE